jgi:mannan endo-1,4-beta-mannosidase
MKKLLSLFFVLLFILPASAAGGFVRVSGGHFERDGKPYYFVGTNMWYGAILGSEGRGGDRRRLCRELDYLKRNGIDNLRILVGSDGEEGVRTRENAH